MVHRPQGDRKGTTMAVSVKMFHKGRPPTECAWERMSHAEKGLALESKSCLVFDVHRELSARLEEAAEKEYQLSQMEGVV